mgnify:CR=1 FL=1
MNTLKQKIVLMILMVTLVVGCWGRIKIICDSCGIEIKDTLYGSVRFATDEYCLKCGLEVIKKEIKNQHERLNSVVLSSYCWNTETFGKPFTILEPMNKKETK